MSHNWKNILVSSTATIQEVLKVIDSEALQLALVVDTDNRLLGTVTDGDIRRALINAVPLSHQISEIMFTTPTVVNVDTSKEKILELMNVKQLHSIPILDDGIVVGLETIHHVTQKNKYDNPVFLMAGGFGTRLKPLTDNCPKPLLKVGDKPILETVLLSFIKSGFHNFYISTHYLPEMIQEYFGDGSKWGISINYVHEEQPLGTGGALGLLPNNLPELPVIMMNGDVLTKVDLEALLVFHNENNADATMCVREYEYQVPFGVIESEGKTIKSMVEKPIQRFHVNAGIYVVSRKIIEEVNNNEVVDMPTLLERYLDNKVLMFPFHEYWLDIGRMDDFKRAQSDIYTLGFVSE
ncbi:nucleotidyltransferase family protein [Colwellia hornerae]|uniref:CBS domain-containing protein n=1 Tax=Colwellia hornerae TaxID=89402 RepID=A0A5C6QJ17_9GAMM|nr:nucleotidyltransferase family protein [Colwellia hornerae]TWX54061.1 CBS domain-containing protein [Colwellia hornerae]TWX60836.1 CBS domain-containing protein [Colwellia hornerae]TWX69166.1 CBS domain-containing protein [Colwellia hornerae]